MKKLLVLALLSCTALCETVASIPSQADTYLINNLRMGYRNMPWKIDGKTFKVKRGHYQLVRLDPGRHSIQFDGGKQTMLDVQPGSSIYLAPEERGLGFGGFHVNMLPTESGKFEISNLQSQ